MAGISKCRPKCLLFLELSPPIMMKVRIGFEIGITDSQAWRKKWKNICLTWVSRAKQWMFSETKPIEPYLRSRRRPLRGGLQINFGGFLCTLGFIAVRNGVNGYVTNSHCTQLREGSKVPSSISRRFWNHQPRRH